MTGRRAFVGVIGVTASAVLLAGCSGVAIPGLGSSPTPTASVSANPQVKAACAAISTELQGAYSDLQTAISVAATNPAKAQKIMEKRQKSLAKVAKKLDNAQVRAQLEKLAASVQSLVDSLGEVVKDPTKVGTVTSAAGGLLQDVSSLQALCAS
ncbi:MAG: hypothetical protein QM779_14990 [Propionicimonas sp.]|uniref:hypothetical protein n=1 Tax=Propionicimonas sp. TaxID=1955623 RepID=UPI003D0E1BB7